MQSAHHPATDRMSGFPPTEDALVSLATWQEASNVRWAFQHMREIIPSQPIRADPQRVRPLRTHLEREVLDAWLTRLDGTTSTAAEVFADTWTDALIVLSDGVVVHEGYLAGTTPATPHLLMSVSKSVVGCVAGILAEQGVLDPDALTTHYIPELKRSGYDGATVRDVLDMRTGVAFRETYDLPDAEVRVMERSMGWRPIEDGDPAGMYEYLATLGSAGGHGGHFTYRSADTDVRPYHRSHRRRLVGSAGDFDSGADFLVWRTAHPNTRTNRSSPGVDNDPAWIMLRLSRSAWRGRAWICCAQPES